jgi:hypothetical protein
MVFLSFQNFQKWSPQYLHIIDFPQIYIVGPIFLEETHGNNASTSPSAPLTEELSTLQEYTTGVIFVLGTVLYFSGMIGNLITVLIIVFTKRLHSSTYVTIACLAVSDIMASSSRYILFCFIVINSFHGYLKSIIVDFFAVFFLLSATCHIMLLSYIRYVFLVKLLKSLKFTCRKVLKISLIIWIFSLIMSMVYALYVLDLIPDSVCHLTFIAFSILFGGIPFLVVLFSYQKNLSPPYCTKANREIKG